MTLRSFNDGNSDEARQFLLDRRCERNHPKRHRTTKRIRAAVKKKRNKLAYRSMIRAKALTKYRQQVREYWLGESDCHPEPPK